MCPVSNQSNKLFNTRLFYWLSEESVKREKSKLHAQAHYILELRGTLTH